MSYGVDLPRMTRKALGVTDLRVFNEDNLEIYQATAQVGQSVTFIRGVSVQRLSREEIRERVRLKGTLRCSFFEKTYRLRKWTTIE